MPDQVRHDGKGLSSRSAPILSSRSAPIRDLALLALSKERRCRIRSGMTGRDCHPVSSRGACPEMILFRNPKRDLVLYIRDPAPWCSSAVIP